MKPRMSEGETALFAAFLKCARRYVEFGCGGSTVLACELVKEFVISVDSSADWLGQVRRACSGKPVQPTLLHVDIGPIREWGYPVGSGSIEKWPDYHNNIWQITNSGKGDFYFIDGRFRVACFLQTLLRCPDDALIAMHDYRSRSQYFGVERFSRPVAESGDLTVFQKSAGVSTKELVEALSACASDPA